MHHLPVANTQFYRVADWGRKWKDVLAGSGSYFSAGGRYNRAHQRTVYAAADPLVAITEFAYHQAVRWQRRMGRGMLEEPQVVSPPTPPFQSEHWLWCFTLHKPPLLVDVEDPAALAQFQHLPYEVGNPCGAYRTTADLADAIRHPNPPHPSNEGILAPSVRTPPIRGYRPRQHILFVPHHRLAVPGTLVKKWKLILEFGDLAGESVTRQTSAIDWVRPWFRLAQSTEPVPAYVPRPKAKPFSPGVWHRLTIAYA